MLFVALQRHALRGTATQEVCMLFVAGVYALRGTAKTRCVKVHESIGTS